MPRSMIWAPSSATMIFAGGQIAMEDAEPMQFLNGLTDLLRKVDGLVLLQPAPFGDDLFQGGAGYVVEDDGHAVGQFVRGFDAGESRAGAAAQGRPNATLGQHGRDLLADERADAVDVTSSVTPRGPRAKTCST